MIGSPHSPTIRPQVQTSKETEYFIHQARLLDEFLSEASFGKLRSLRVRVREPSNFQFPKLVTKGIQVVVEVEC